MPRHVVVSQDASASSLAALQWVVDNVLRAQDVLHIVSVACPPDMPVSYRSVFDPGQAEFFNVTAVLNGALFWSVEYA